MLRHGNPNGAWTDYDYLLAEAIEVLDSEYCQMCGQPKWLCHTDSDEIQFRVYDDHCYATERIERIQKQNAEKKNYDGAGVRLVAAPYSTTGLPLSEYREPYYRDLVKKAEERKRLAAETDAA